MNISTQFERTGTRSDVDDLQTPCLLLDRLHMDRNINRLRAHLARFGVVFRPHLKTAKSIEVAKRMISEPTGPAMVSTLREAEQFAAAGITDLVYGVGIAPGKLGRIVEMRRQGIDLAMILDSIEQAWAVGEAAAQSGLRLEALIEIDSDGHRAGLQPDSPAVIACAEALVKAGGTLRGVVTHAGDSYNIPGDAAIIRAAEQERAGAVAAAERLRAAGFPCPTVSVGSTPTAHFVQNLDGVTEVRAGNFVFFDLVMADLGVCSQDDIALSVLATIIGRQSERGRLFIDAGWMALSRDRSTAGRTIDQGYGVVCDEAGRPFGDVIVTEVSQEHGTVQVRPGSSGVLPDLPVGAKIRILPNHACATGAQHQHYEVVDNGRLVAEWPRFSGW